MNTIDSEGMRARLATGTRLWLIHDGACSSFRDQHLPGAIAFVDVDQAARALRPEDAIIVYGRDEQCESARVLAIELTRRGFGDVCWFRGGLREWIESGGRVEGSLESPWS